MTFVDKNGNLKVTDLTGGTVDEWAENAERVIWQERSLVTLTTTTSMTMAENGLMSNFNSGSGYRGIVRLEPGSWFRSTDTMQVKLFMNYVTKTAPGVFPICELYEFATLTGGAIGSTTLLGTGQPGTIPGADTVGAAETPWIDLTGTKNTIPTFRWSAASSAADMLLDMQLRVRKKP